MKKNVKLSFLIALLLSFANLSWGQQRTISGQVTDDGGEGLPGVTIVEKNTTNGTVSDANGNYSINVSENAEALLFSFIGMESQEVILGSSNSYSVQLHSSSIGIDEVVAIGYGTIRKSDLTGAVASVKSEDLVRANPVSAVGAIQGQVAGVVITKANSKPGEGFNINIRGLNSFSYDNGPLIVIDGVVDADLNSLNPSDIQSMDILKDASSTAIYGSRGANGVVIITTKRGSIGAPSITYDGYVGVKVPSHLPDMQNGEEFFQASRVDRVEMGSTAQKKWTETEQYSVDNGLYVDWIDEVTEPGLQTNHSFAMNGGTDRITYFGSVGYLNEDGNIIHTGYTRYTAKGSMDVKVNDFIKVGLTSNYRYGKQVLGSSETLRSAYRARPTGVVYYDDVINPTAREINSKGYAVWMGMADNQVINPLVEADPDNYQREKLQSDYTGNAYLQINPIKALTLKSSISARKYDERQGEYRGTLTKSQKTSRAPRAFYDTRILSTYTWDNTINYKKKINAHNINILAGQSVFKRIDERSELDVEDLPYNSLWYNQGNGATVTKYDTGLTERSLLSYMARLVYEYNRKYMLTVTSRWDGASQLAKGHKWDFFPSAALAWRLGEEEIIKSIDKITALKLRISYGAVGNASVNPYATQANIAQTNYAFGDAVVQGYYPGNLTDQALGWEKSKELNIGVDLGLFNNRISTSVELYKRNTDDLITREKIPQSSGYNEAVTNIGEVQNKGIEVTMNTANIDQSNFRWNTNITFAYNKNEVISIGSDGITQDIGNGLFVGYPLNVNYDYKFAGVWQIDEVEEAAKYNMKPGQIKVVDQNEDDKISADDDRVILGSRQPDWTMGVLNSFTFKNFDLSCLVYTSQGVQFKNSMLDGTMGQIGAGRYNALDLDYWMPDNPTNNYFAPGVKDTYRRQSIVFQDASFIRVKDITLGYTFSKNQIDRLKMQSLRIYAQVLNPFVFHDFDGMDPEFNSGTYNDDVPSATYLFGVKCTF